MSESVQYPDSEIFLPPISSIIAVKCDSNSKISQNVRKLIFFSGKKLWFFENTSFFSQNLERWQMCSEMGIRRYSFFTMAFFPPEFEFFLQKFKKSQILLIVLFFSINHSHPSALFSAKLEG